LTKNTEQIIQMVDQTQTEWGYVFFCLSTFGMVVILTVASCTSAQDFHYIYTQIAEFLSLSKTSLSMSLRGSPNLGHFLCYILLSFSLSGVFPRRFAFIAPLVAGFFGMFMESVQSFIPSRDASLMDIGINFLGAGIGFGVYKLWVTYVRVFLSTGEVRNN
jgi:VanZ family protein